MKNCLTYALGMWFRHGGYLIIRRSRFHEAFESISKWHPAYWVPHFLHRSKDHVITQYTVTESQRVQNIGLSAWRKWLHLWNFDGVVTGDDLPQERKTDGS